MRFYYDGNQVIEERNSSDQVQKQYVYGNGVDEIVRMDKYEGVTPQVYYYHTNAIGSVTAVTDSTGALVERILYDDYGNPTFIDHQTDPQNPTEATQSLIANLYLFQGRRYDHETGLYYYRARYFDPHLARFLQTDPRGYIDSLNLYQAFGQSPANFVDPFGERLVLDKRYFSSKSKYERFKSNVITMLKYLFVGSEAARKYLTSLITDPNFDIYIMDASGEGHMQYLPDEGVYSTIYWGKKKIIKEKRINPWHGVLVDPYSGLQLVKKIYEGDSFKRDISLDEVQSPALGFMHELIHGYLDREGISFITGWIKQYGNYLEKRVVGEERRIAIELGEPIRFSHGGDVYRVSSPTAHCLSIEHKFWYEDYLGNKDEALIVDFEKLVKLIVEIGEIRKK